MGARPFGKRFAVGSIADERLDAGTLIRIIAERRASDPLICEKIAGDEMLRTMTTAMAERDPRGVHAETLIGALAALAGQACLVSARATAALLVSAPPSADFPPDAARSEATSVESITGADGRRYYSGNGIDGPLFAQRLSVWNIILESASGDLVAAAPDSRELLAHVAATVGTPKFGLPRPAPGGFPPVEPPLAFVCAFWPLLLGKARLFCPLPEQWPVLYAFATRQAIALCREAVRPEIAIRLALECAVPMSRFDPFG